MQITNYNDDKSLAQALATKVAVHLVDAIEQRGQASLAVSGGSTPRTFMQVLSHKEVAWDKVVITLVDERWVAPSSTRANAKLVADCLLQNRAAQAHFVPLYVDACKTVEDALPILDKRINAIPQPFDVLTLGMGGDGHTASFFPGGDYLSQALNPQQTRALLPMRAAHVGETRITFTLAWLKRARFTYLHIEGDAKREVLARAQAQPADYPIGAVIRQMPQLEACWCP